MRWGVYLLDIYTRTQHEALELVIKKGGHFPSFGVFVYPVNAILWHLAEPYVGVF